MAKPVSKEKQKELDAKKKEEQLKKREMPLDDYLKKLGVIDGEVLASSQYNRKTYSTGVFGLDLALNCIDPETGLSGLPARSITEIVGPNQSLKTAMMEQLSLDMQQRDERNLVLWICAEEPNMKRALELGLDRKRIIPLHVFHEDLNEQYARADFAMKQALKLCHDRKEVTGIFIDSIKALCNDVIDVNKTDQALTKVVVASRAQLLNAFIRNFRALNRSDALLFMTNQITVTSIGDGRPSFGAGAAPSSATPSNWDTQMDTAAGHGKAHDCDFRIYAKGEPWYAKNGKDLILNPIFNAPIQIGIEVHHRLFKSKAAADDLNRRSTAFFHLKNKRFETERQVLTLAEGTGLVGLDGAWYKFSETEKAQGFEKAVQYLKGNPQLLHRLKQQLAADPESIFECGLPKSEAVLG